MMKVFQALVAEKKAVNTQKNHLTALLIYANSTKIKILFLQTNDKTHKMNSLKINQFLQNNSGSIST